MRQIVIGFVHPMGGLYINKTINPKSKKFKGDIDGDFEFGFTSHEYHFSLERRDGKYTLRFAGHNPSSHLEWSTIEEVRVIESTANFDTVKLMSVVANARETMLNLIKDCLNKTDEKSIEVNVPFLEPVEDENLPYVTTRITRVYLVDGYIAVDVCPVGDEESVFRDFLECYSMDEIYKICTYLAKI